MAREIRPTYPKLKTKALEAARARAREGGLAAMTREDRRAKRAAAVDLTIPADLSIPAFLKRAA